MFSVHKFLLFGFLETNFKANRKIFNSTSLRIRVMSSEFVLLMLLLQRTVVRKTTRRRFLFPLCDTTKIKDDAMNNSELWIKKLQGDKRKKINCSTSTCEFDGFTLETTFCTFAVLSTRERHLKNTEKLKRRRKTLLWSLSKFHFDPFFRLFGRLSLNNSWTVESSLGLENGIWLWLNLNNSS